MINKKTTYPGVPVIAERILKLFSDDLENTKSGDFEEEYNENIKLYGVKKAKLLYRRQILKSIPAAAGQSIYRSLIMFKNYLRIAYRNFANNKVFSSINILGLSIGMAVCLVIIQYVVREMSYDKFHENGKNIFRLRTDSITDGKLTDSGADCVAAAGKAVFEDFPEVLDYVKLSRTSAGGIFAHKERKLEFREERVYFATSSMFNIFSFEMLLGDAEKALSEPNNILISRSIAEKYFKEDNDPIGKSLSFNGVLDYSVMGVFEDIPDESHMKFDILTSFPTMLRYGDWVENSWAYTTFYTYLLLKDGTDPVDLEIRINESIKSQVEEIRKEWGFKPVLKLQHLQDIHLRSNHVREIEQNGDFRLVYFMLIIAFFVLGIAWINYINLSTARSLTRAKEVGVRKVMGAFRYQLIKQFLTEFMLLNLIAAAISIMIMQIALPYFNAFTDMHISFTLWLSASFWAGFILLILTGGLLSGFYPAIFLSSFRPISILKGKLINSVKGRGLRKGLVGFQFASSVLLIICTLTVQQQLRYLQKKDLGIDVEQTLILKGATVSADRSRETYVKRVETFKNELQKNPSVISTSISNFVPSEDVWLILGARKVTDTVERQKEYHIMRVDHDFFDLYDMEMISGRAFSKDFQSDERAVIVNETALDHLGFSDPESALDQEIIMKNNEFKIIGVVKNYNQESLKEAFEPTLFYLTDLIRGRCAIKLNTGNISETISYIKNTWDNYYPGNPFDYFFLDENYHALYDSERQFGKMFGLFALFAIIIACLGLFGLSYFTTIQRIKEIGIRKVLGASEMSLVRLLTRELTVIIAVSNIIAWPAAGFLMVKWLQEFAFRINLSWKVFFTGFAVTFIIAMITVGYQSLRAALSNPVNSLRHE